MQSDGDFMVIVFLWLLYIGLHVCFDYCERRTLQRADEAEAQERERMAAVRRQDLERRGRREGRSRGQTPPVTVIIVGAEGDPNTNYTDPCEGAIVPDANGQMPVLPEPVQYGEASYMNSPDPVNGTKDELEKPAEKNA